MTATLETFVIVFRQGSFSLTDDDQERRAELTRVWVRDINAKGQKLYPNILTPETAQRGTELPFPADAWRIPALLVTEAHDRTTRRAWQGRIRRRSTTRMWNFARGELPPEYPSKRHPSAANATVGSMRNARHVGTTHATRHTVIMKPTYETSIRLL